MTLNPQEEFSTLIGEIYDASLSADRWALLLQRLSTVLAKAGLSLYVRDLEAEEVRPGSAEDMEPEAAQASARFHLTIKVNASRPGQPGARSSALGDEIFASGADLAESAGEPLAPPESIVLGCFISRDRPAGSLVAIQRSHQDERSAHWDTATLRRLASHLRRAFDLHNQFLTLNVERDSTKRVLDHLTIGVLLVDSGSRVLAMNACAKTIVAQGDGLAVERSGVCAANSDQTTALRVLIKGAASGNGREAPGGGIMALSRPSLRRPYWALVTALLGGGAEDGLPAVAALFVADPERRHEIPAQLLERFFGLTPAETRLLSALVNGMSLDDASEEFQVSKNTLRTQLHHIFRKTDTSRQSEVVKLALSAPVQMKVGAEDAD